MSKKNKWKMNRTGLLNFWYYDDEIFNFSDGKLLLRGSNGSGKSVTMQSILPVLLDGKKSPDRLDPFGSRARRMEDYLLGEKEIVNRDERTGYLFIEYKREGTNQYITTGIGLQARRHKQMNFWGFIITDNRRIGKNFFLYDYEHQAGKKEQIPLSRIQLENRIGTGGHVVRTQGEYMRLVNKYIFGFETIEAYEDLIKLLIQLRSPKLSKDFRPTVIYEILEAALPPLTDEDLRHLSDTIEHMDQTKQQIEQLEREQAALNNVIQRYDTYNQYRLADTANHYLHAKRQFQKEEKTTEEKKLELEVVGKEIVKLQERNQELEQNADILAKKQNRLQKHKVWSLEEEKKTEENRLKEIETDFVKKENMVGEKIKQERSVAEQIDELQSSIARLESRFMDQLADLEMDAQQASFHNHSLNVQDFERNKQTDFDFTLWKKEAEAHFERIENISEKLRTYEQMKDEIAVLDKTIADTRLEIDQTRQAEKDWLQVFEKDKQDKISEIHTWAEENLFLQINTELLQQASREMLRLYEPISYESIRTGFLRASNTYQLQVNEAIAIKNSELAELKKQLEEQESLLTIWKEKRDPEPPNQHDKTKEARKKLAETGAHFIPFYEAVEFQEHVQLEDRKRIEAALMDVGILDALITDGKIPFEHDRIIQANPQMMAHTLADYLIPDVDEKGKIDATIIDEVLRSVLVGDENDGSAPSIQPDGTYTIGCIHGHAVPVESVRFIGRTARRRYREEQIKLIRESIEVLRKEEEKLVGHIKSLQANVLAAQSAMNDFPIDDDLQVSFNEIKEKRFKIEQLQKQLLAYDKKMNEIINTFQQLKRTLDVDTKELNIVFTHSAYQDAKHTIRRYEKELSDFETLHVTYRHKQNSLTQMEDRLEELRLEVDDIKGELNVIQDKRTRMKQNIIEMNKELEAHGVEDVRKQIQEVQQEIEETEKELTTIRITLPQKEADQGVLRREIEEQEQKLRFSQMMIDAWLTIFSQEVNYHFITFPEKLDTIESLAKWVWKHYRHLLRDFEFSKVDKQLTDVYYAELSNLMEYRMIDQPTKVPQLDVESTEWTDEQQVLLENWKNKASRRIIQLDFQGKRLSPYYIQEMVENDRARQQTLLNDQDRQLYEEILFDSVGKKLRSRIYRAQQWTRKMNELMENSDSTSGIRFSIRWKPRTAETEAELDTKELVDLLRRDPRLLKEDDLQQVMEHFRSKIERAKELIDIKGEGNTLLQVLKEVLDYRYWFSFVLSYQRIGEPKRELTNHAFYKFSGGEKAMAMYIPLFTACYSRYLEADETAPYIITLDEAFAGVDDDNISVMFRIVEELGFDYMMNSQVLWGDYDTVSSLSICELVRPKNASFVSVIRYVWDGKSRRLVVDEEETKGELVESVE